MNRPTRSLIAVLALNWCALPIAVIAQSDAGTVHVIVLEEKTNAPIPGARVILDGVLRASAVTAGNGAVDFSDVDAGIYTTRVLKQGYATVTGPAFEVRTDRIVTVRVVLSTAERLKTIGEVRARSTSVSSTAAINQSSAQRRLSNDLAGALNKLSGVSVSTNGSDSDATQTISLEGHDASQTQLSLDGIPLNVPGSAGNLGMFASDLFAGASVSFGPSIGGLGGSVNFTTLQPTLSWLTQLALSTGSDGRYNYSIGESGSLGKLGLAVQTVYRLSPSLVDGDRYLDASGQDYVHEGDSDYDGNLVKLQYRLSDSQTVSAAYLNSGRTTDLVCLTQYAAPALPCGYGPGNTARFDTQLYSLADNALVGATQVQGSLFSMSFGNDYDALDRTVAVSALGGAIVPSPSPLAYSGLGRVRGFSIDALLPAKERHTVSIQVYGTQSSQLTTPLIASAGQFYSGSSTSHYGVLQVTDTIRANEKLTLAGSLGASSAVAGAGTIAGASAAWRPTAVDTYSASYAVTGAGAGGPQTTILSDPASLNFDCNGDVAYGTAPSGSPGRTSSQSARIGYTRSLRRGSIAVSLYRQVENGATIPSLVNGTSLEQLFPAGYLQQVRELYESPAGCNAKAVTFGAQQLYFMMPVESKGSTYEGGSITGSLTLGNLVVQPYYDVNVAQAGSNTYFENPYSITIVGAQVPGVPIQRGGLVLDYKSRRSIFEWLGDAQYVAQNNPNHLPSYVTFDAGVNAQLLAGSVTFALSNITNRYAGVFAGSENAVPYRTLAGYVVGTTARPLSPRTLSVTYDVLAGSGARGEESSTGAGPGAPSFPGGQPGAMPPMEPGGPGPFPGSGPVGGRPAFAGLPAAPPADPFAVTNSSQTCTTDGKVTARRLADQLKGAVANIELVKSAGRYPSVATLSSSGDATLTYHGLQSAYAISITPRQSALRAIVGCFTVRMARDADVRERGLYAPSSTLFGSPQVQFMPAVGLYVVPPSTPAGTEEFRVYTLPAVPPVDAFAMHPSAACAGDALSVATQNLEALRSHFATGSPAPGWSITAHPARPGAWYELVPGDPSVVPALLRCARIAMATSSDLENRGFGAAVLPTLNFTPSLGLYAALP